LPKLKGGSALKVANKLISAGFAEEMEAEAPRGAKVRAHLGDAMDAPGDAMDAHTSPARPPLRKTKRGPEGRP
jgi:hypothetical protein